MDILKKLKFWKHLLKLLKKDVKNDYKISQEEIDQDLFYPNYDKNNHDYRKL